MKKRILYSLAIATAALSFTSCDNFLEEHPKDQITQEQAFQSPTLIYLNAVATLYTNVGGNSGGNGLQGTDRGIYDLNTFTTDEAVLPTRGGDWYDGGLWQNLFKHNWGTKNDLVKGSWEYLYKVIVMCNNSLATLENVLQNDPTNTAVPTYIAEVRAFRAMYYYYLVDMYGNVPLITSSNVKMADVIQSKRSDVFKFVVKELQESVGLLSSTHSNLTGEYYGRMTKPVAYYLLAKLALNSEIYTFDNWNTGYANRPSGKDIKFTVGGTQMNAWETTIAYCDSITNLGYSLASNFASNFSTTNETSPENIYTIPMDRTTYPDNQFYNLIRSRHYNQAKAYGQGGWNGACATKEALDAFGYGTASVDPRFSLTYYAGKVTGPDGKNIKLDDGTDLEYIPSEVALDLSGKAAEKTAGARMKKYELDVSATNDGKNQSNDIVLFRYADVLLMKSEAKVRNGISGDNELLAVRARAGASQDVKATLDNILAEREREFAWEGLRRQDLIRFGMFTRAYTDRPQLANEANGWSTVFPIHEDVLAKNPKLVQNPGY
jgi:SusD family.